MQVTLRGACSEEAQALGDLGFAAWEASAFAENDAGRVESGMVHLAAAGAVDAVLLSVIPRERIVDRMKQGHECAEQNSAGGIVYVQRRRREGSSEVRDI